MPINKSNEPNKRRERKKKINGSIFSISSILDGAIAFVFFFRLLLVQKEQDRAMTWSWAPTLLGGTSERTEKTNAVQKSGCKQESTPKNRTRNVTQRDRLARNALLCTYTYAILLSTFLSICIFIPDILSSSYYIN